ncbi:MAG: fimbria/pilus outer membrane usher protein [Rhodopila sp.]|nr:fimbria/pilus outer membrane usher protein [Rhodopila sp.]
MLELVVNGYSTGKIGEFVLRDGALFAQRDELSGLGFRIPESASPTRDGLIALAALTGVTSRIDQATQTLYVTAAPDRLLPTLLQADTNGAAAEQAESGTGATLNYDVTGVLADGRNTASGSFDLRAFSPWGVVSSGVLAYAGGGPGGVGTDSAIRLDSAYVYSDPDTLRRYRLGDFTTSGLGWTRQVRLGGAQINSDFSMRPDLVTFPLPSVSGSVAVPSTVDVLVNGTQLLSRQVQPGPFQIAQLPVVTGTGTVAMTVTDALGRQVTTTLPFYASSSLLAPGLQSYSVEVGKVRRNWGILSDDYGDLAGSATYRRGLSSAVTVEAHAEGTVGQAMGGAVLVVNVANLGMANFAAASSTASGLSGTQLSAGMQRIGRVFSVGASATMASHNFRDLAAMNGDPAPQRQINANAGLSLGRFGSLGVAYTAVDRDAVPAPIRFFAPPGSFVPQNFSTAGGVPSIANDVVSFQPAQRSHILTVSYSSRIGKVSIFATGFHDFAAKNSTGVMFGLSIPLGGRGSASANAGSGSSGGYAQIQAQQSAVSTGDWGYQAYATRGTLDHEFAELSYKSPWALVSAGADRIDRQTTLRTEAQGALSFADGGLFPSNTINDSFAVVDTDGVKGIHVLNENREVGTTDSAGRLLVPDLRSYDLNHIAIDPVDVPMDAMVPTTEQNVRPQDRSGVVVRFPVQTSHGALLRLVDKAGGPIAIGSTATLATTGVTVPVGYGGEAFVQDLSPGRNQLTIERPNGQRCVAILDYRVTPGEIPTIGPLPCQEQAP